MYVDDVNSNPVVGCSDIDMDDTATGTPGTLLNIYVLLIPVILEHWTDISATGWLLLLIFGMGSQLI